MTPLSLLQNFRESFIERTPFPHCLIDPCLPSALYERLANEFPEPQVFYANSHRLQEGEVKPNAFYKINASKVYADNNLVSGLWNDFIHYHTSQEFFDEVLDKFGDTIRKAYPGLIEKMTARAGGGAPRRGVRYVSAGSDRYDVDMDFMVGINSPTDIGGTRVIGPHLDNPKMLCAGMFYLRHPEDRSNGGDFVLYERKDPANPAYINRRHISDDSLIERKVVPYKANSLLWFLNGFASCHGVSAREATPYPRRLCELVLDTERTVPKLFKLDGSELKKESAFDLVRRFVKGR